MKPSTFISLALSVSLTASFLVVRPVDASPDGKGKPFFASVRESLRNYQSAQQALRRAPQELSTRKQLIGSYLGVIDARLERMAEAVRVVAPSLTSDTTHLTRIETERSEIAEIMTQLEKAESSQDLASITERVRALGTFTNITTSRARILNAHRDVLYNKGIVVLESRVEQMSYALAILAKNGKDVSSLQTSIANLRAQIAEAKKHIEGIAIAESIDTDVYAEKRNALNAAEAHIRSIFADLDTLSQQGRAIRDTE